MANLKLNIITFMLLFYLCESKSVVMHPEEISDNHISLEQIKNVTIDADEEKLLALKEDIKRAGGTLEKIVVEVLTEIMKKQKMDQTENLDEVESTTYEDYDVNTEVTTNDETITTEETTHSLMEDNIIGQVLTKPTENLNSIENVTESNDILVKLSNMLTEGDINKNVTQELQTNDLEEKLETTAHSSTPGSVIVSTTDKKESSSTLPSRRKRMVHQEMQDNNMKSDEVPRTHRKHAEVKHHPVEQNRRQPKMMDDSEDFSFQKPPPKIILSKNGPIDKVHKKQKDIKEDKERVGQSLSSDPPFCINDQSNTYDKQHIDDLKYEVSKLRSVVELLKEQQKLTGTFNAQSKSDGPLNEQEMLNILSKINQPKPILNDKSIQLNEIDNSFHAKEVEALKHQIKEAIINLNRTKEILQLEHQKEHNLEEELKSQRTELNWLKLVIENFIISQTRNKLKSSNMDKTFNITDDPIVGAALLSRAHNKTIPSTVRMAEEKQRELEHQKKSRSNEDVDFQRKPTGLNLNTQKARASEFSTLGKLLDSISDKGKSLDDTDDIDIKMLQLERELKKKKEQKSLAQDLLLIQKLKGLGNAESKSDDDLNLSQFLKLQKALKGLDSVQSKNDDFDIDSQLKLLQKEINNLRTDDDNLLNGEGKAQNDPLQFQIMLNKLIAANPQFQGRLPPITPQQMALLQQKFGPGFAASFGGMNGYGPSGYGMSPMGHLGYGAYGKGTGNSYGGNSYSSSYKDLGGSGGYAGLINGIFSKGGAYGASNGVPYSSVGGSSGNLYGNAGPIYSGNKYDASGANLYSNSKLYGQSIYNGNNNYGANVGNYGGPLDSGSYGINAGSTGTYNGNYGSAGASYGKIKDLSYGPYGATSGLYGIGVPSYGPSAGNGYGSSNYNGLSYGSSGNGYGSGNAIGASYGSSGNGYGSGNTIGASYGSSGNAYGSGNANGASYGSSANGYGSSNAKNLYSMLGLNKGYGVKLYGDNVGPNNYGPLNSAGNSYPAPAYQPAPTNYNAKVQDFQYGSKPYEGPPNEKLEGYVEIPENNYDQQNYVDNSNFFPAQSQGISYGSSPQTSYGSSKPTDQAYQDKPSGYSGQNAGPYQPYANAKVDDLKTQIYSLQNAINSLNRPEYTPTPEDKNTIYNLEQQIDELKGVVNSLNAYSAPQAYNPNDYKQPTSNYQPQVPKDYPAPPQAPPDTYNRNSEKSSKQTKTRRRRSVENNEIDRSASDTLDKITNMLQDTFQIQNKDTTSVNKQSENPMIPQPTSKNQYPQQRHTTIDGIQKRIQTLREQLGGHPLLKVGATDKQANYNPETNPRSYDYDAGSINYGLAPLMTYGGLPPIPSYQPTLHTKDFKDSKKIDVFKSIVAKIMDKLIESTPIVIQKLFGFTISELTGYGDDDYNYGDYGSVIKVFRNLGIFGYLPLIFLRLIKAFSAFLRILQKNKFIKNFLVPIGIIGLVGGAVIFLIWWMQPNDYYQVGYEDNYSNGYDDYAKSNNGFGSGRIVKSYIGDGRESLGEGNQLSNNLKRINYANYPESYPFYPPVRTENLRVSAMRRDDVNSGL